MITVLIGIVSVAVIVVGSAMLFNSWLEKP